MALLGEQRIRSRDDLSRFEAEMTLGQRLPERSVLDVFIGNELRFCRGGRASARRLPVRSPRRGGLTPLATLSPP